MRKKLDTRFPAARIKKIMQTDEDVGKIAMAVPLLVSKALELFLQDLCDRTHETTLQTGAKTINSLHLKQCVHTFNMFDFLKDTVSKVPDLGGSDATSEDRPSLKRRKNVDLEENGSDEELKRSKTNKGVDNMTGSVRGGRGRGSGRGRGRPRGCRTKVREATIKYEDDTDLSKINENDDYGLDGTTNLERPTMMNEPKYGNAEPTVRNFDLNMDPNENVDSITPPIAAQDEVSPVTASPEFKHEGYPSWSLAEIEKMAIDPVHLANLNRVIGDDYEDEDYDEEN